ncbi:MAG: hypothetical protein GEV11_30125, partial [Streptosporangiales bacterium]|nr:hypothetical protein [Streptosporangiales bacterium]
TLLDARPPELFGDAGPLSPLTEALAELARERGSLGLHPGLVVDSAEATGWLSASRLAAPGSQVLSGLLAATAERCSAPSHVAAAFVWKSYGFWTAMPVALGWALNRRVPLPSIHDTIVRVLDEAPNVVLAARAMTTAVLAGDPYAGTPGTVTVPDEAALGTLVRRVLLEEHHAAMIAALGRLTRVSNRGLWGSVAEALTYGIRFAATATPRLRPTSPTTAPSAAPTTAASPTAATTAASPADPMGTEMRNLLARVGGPVTGLVEVHDTAEGVDVRRRTCCFAITVPGLGVCDSCCVPRDRS